jgi:glycine betaine/choline ABC-type transport system substrate-binding protein
MNKSNALLFVVPAFMLMAAGPVPYSPQDSGLGQTVDSIIAAQAIDMYPEYAGVPLEGSNGKRSVDAYRRYQSGNVKKLLKQTGEAQVGSQGGAVEQITTPPPSQGN